MYNNNVLLLFFIFLIDKHSTSKIWGLFQNQKSVKKIKNGEKILLHIKFAILWRRIVKVNNNISLNLDIDYVEK